MTDLDELDRAAIRRLLDGPAGPTGHLAGAAKRTAQRRAARRRAGLASSGAAAAVAVAAAGIPALLGGTVSLTAGPAGQGGPPAAVAAADRAAATASSLGMNTDGLADAHFRIAVACLRRSGVDAPLPAAAAAAATVRSPWLAQSGISYGSASRANTGAEPADPKAWEAAMYGQPRREAVIPIENGGSVRAPVGGCHGHATEKLYGVPAEDYERLYQQVRPLPEQAVQAAVRDGGVREAARRWSGCLGDAGWEAGTPDDLDNALSPWLVAGGEELARQESALHAADRQCRDRSGLQAAFDAAFADAGERVATGNGTALAEYRSVLAHAHRVAAGR